MTERAVSPGSGRAPIRRASIAPFPHLSKHLCAICNGPLSVHQEVRGGVCDKPQCRRKYALQQAARRQREQQEALRRTAEAWRHAVASSSSARNPRLLPLAIVRSNDRRLAPLPKRRKQALRTYLSEMIGQAESTSPAQERKEGQDPMNRELTPGARAMLGGACATCKGHCCAGGDTHAYLDAATIRRHMLSRPDAKPGDVLEAFSRRLPGKSYRGSCVYHGSRGCALPREMRASVCNAFYCSGLNELRTQLDASGHAPVFVVAAYRDQLVRSSVVDGSGTRAVRRRKPVIPA